MQLLAPVRELFMTPAALKPAPIRDAQDAVVGIDAALWIRTLVDPPQQSSTAAAPSSTTATPAAPIAPAASAPVTSSSSSPTTTPPPVTCPLREPALGFIGGPPLTLGALIARELAEFERHKITPLFVFRGVDNPRDRPKTVLFPYQRLECFRSKGSEANEQSFLDVSRQSVKSADFLTMVMRLMLSMRSPRCHVFRSPYASSTQLAYFVRTNYVQFVYGEVDLLLNVGAGVKLITSIDWSRGEFHYLQRDQIPEFAPYSPDTFLDAALVYQMYSVQQKLGFPPDRSSRSLPSVFRTVLNRLHERKNIVYGGSYEESLIPQGHTDIDKYNQNRSLVKYQPYLNQACACELSSKDDIPQKLHEHVGPRLYNEIYWLISRGLIDPHVIYFLTVGIIFDSMPPVDTEELRALVDQLTPLRSRFLSLFASLINPSALARVVLSVRWFNLLYNRPPNEDTQVSVDPTNAPFVYFGAAPDAIAVALESSSPFRFPTQDILQSAIKSFPNAVHVSESHKNGNHAKTHSPTDSRVAICNLAYSTAVSALSILNHIFVSVKSGPGATGHAQSPSHSEASLTDYGRALSVSSNRFFDSSLIILELLRLGKLNERGFRFCSQSDVVRDVYTNPSPTSPLVLLLTRTVSILPMQLSAQPWDFRRVDLDLLAFNCLVYMVHRSLRYTFESSLCSLVLTNVTSVDPRDLSEVSVRLPFLVDSNTALGIVVKSLLTGSIGSLAAAQSAFPQCTRLAEDLSDAFQFVEHVHQMIVSLCGSTSKSPELESLESLYALGIPLLRDTLTSAGVTLS